MSELKLLPCPFCGGEAVSIDGYREAFFVQCEDCGATFPMFDTLSEAIAAWNRRAQPENEALVRCGNCSHWDKSISFMGAHACAYWSPSRKEPRYTEWFEFCSFASAKPERSE